MTNTSSQSIRNQLLLILVLATSSTVEAFAQRQRPIAVRREMNIKHKASNHGKVLQGKINEELANELIKMEAADISAIDETRRTRTGVDPKATEAAMTHWTGGKQHNTERLKVIITRYGWPGRSMVGEKAARAAFTIVQHSDHDRVFQRMCLPLLKAVAKEGEIEPWEIAFLTDRLLVAEGKKQIYGTQFDPCEHSKNDPDTPCAIEDPDNVDQRRKEMGLPPMSDYIKLMRQVRSKSRMKSQKNN
jgi:hypothetical protein